MFSITTTSTSITMTIGVWCFLRRPKGHWIGLNWLGRPATVLLTASNGAIHNAIASLLLSLSLLLLLAVTEGVAVVAAAVAVVVSAGSFATRTAKTNRVLYIFPLLHRISSSITTITLGSER